MGNELLHLNDFVIPQYPSSIQTASIVHKLQQDSPKNNWPTLHELLQTSDAQWRKIVVGAMIKKCVASLLATHFLSKRNPINFVSLYA